MEERTMKSLLIAVIGAGFSFTTPCANATDDALVNDDVVKTFANDRAART